MGDHRACVDHVCRAVRSGSSAGDVVVSGKLRARAEGVAWLAAWRLSRVLPERTVIRAFERMSARSFRRNARQRAAVISNLEPIVGKAAAPAAAREAFRWYGRYWGETFRMGDMSNDEINRRVSIEGAEHIERGIAAGKGVLLVTGHFGNWDAGGRWASQRWPLTAVAEVLRPRILFDRFVAHRVRQGIGIIPLERGADVTAQCLELLAAGGIAALVTDRDLSGTGVEVEMFGRRTRIPAGTAVLSLRSGAPIIVSCAYQGEDGKWRAKALPALQAPDPEAPDAVEALTQRVASALESLFAVAPEQWHVFTPYWID